MSFSDNRGTVAEVTQAYVEQMTPDFRVYADLPDDGMTLLVPQTDAATTWLRHTYPGGRRYRDALAVGTEIAGQIIREAQADLLWCKS